MVVGTSNLTQDKKFCRIARLLNPVLERSITKFVLLSGFLIKNKDGKTEHTDMLSNQNYSNNYS